MVDNSKEAVTTGSKPSAEAPVTGSANKSDNKVSSAQSSVVVGDKDKEKERSIPPNTAAIVVHIRLTPNSPSVDGITTETTSTTLPTAKKSGSTDTTRVEVKTVDDVFYELRRRGFVVESCASDDVYTNKDINATAASTTTPTNSSTKPKKPVPVNYWILVSFSPKLLIRLAALKSYPTTFFNKYTPLQKLQLVQFGIEMIMKVKAPLFIVDAWSAHDPKLVKTLFDSQEVSAEQDVIGTPDSARLKIMLNKKKKKKSLLIGKQLESVYQYFGPQVAIYFGFLNYYTNALIIPSVIGVAVFIHQYFTNEIDTEYVPFFVVLLSIWATWFIQSWKSKCSEYCYSWDTFGIEDLELDRELAKAASKENNTRTMRLLFSFLSTMILIYFMLRIMLYFVDANMRAEELYGDSYEKYYPQIMYSLFPVVSPYIFEPIANFLNKLEQHPTRYEEENYMILKKFSLQFVNRYSALLYVAFYKQDLEMLRSLLISLLTTGAIINNATELGVPLLMDLGKRIMKKWTGKKPVVVAVESDGKKPARAAGRASIASAAKLIMLAKKTSSKRGSFIEPTLRSVHSLLEAKEAEAMVDKERYYTPYDIHSDFEELVVQYGYVILFAAAFPLTPFLAYINNYFEFRVDLMKLSTMQRPPLVLRSSIGAWLTCLQVISFIAILTNCYLLTMVSTKVSVLIPSSFHHHLDSPYGKLLAMIALEHVLFGFNVAFTQFIEQVPRSIREGLARKRVKQLDQEKKQHIKEMQEDGVILDLGDLHNKDKDSTEKDSISKEKSGDTIVSMYSSTNSPYLFGISNPVQMTTLFATPWLLNWFHVSPLLFVPASFFYFAYLQTEKERIERQLAINIVNNQTTLGAFLQDSMPAFIRDHDVQRVEWLNMILQRVWPYFSLALEKLLIPIIQPILTANTPFFLSSLEIKKLSTGSIAPKITGIRVFSMDQQKITLDIELKWVADLHVSLKVGTQPMPTLVELTDLSLNATVRVELLDLIPQLPLFKAYSVTCMKKPEVKFSLKIANMVDIMSIGVHPSFSVTALVQSIINSALNDLVLYPKKLVFPLGDDKGFDESAYASVTPIGHLEVTVERAIDLKAANLFGDSDPYVELVSSMDQKFRTKTIANTLNPVFQQTFTIVVYDTSSQGVEFKVYDYNEYAQSVFLGECSISMSELLTEAANYAAEEEDGENPDPVKAVNTSAIAETGFEDIPKTFPLKNIEKGALITRFTYKPVNSAAGLSSQIGNNADKASIRFANINSDIIYDLPPVELDDNAYILNDVKSPDEIINRSRRNKRKKRNLLKQHRELVEGEEVSEDEIGALSGYESAGTFGSEDLNEDGENSNTTGTKDDASNGKKSSGFKFQKTFAKATNVLKATTHLVNLTNRRKEEADGKDPETQSVTSVSMPTQSPARPLSSRSPGGLPTRSGMNLNGFLIVSSIKAFNLHPPAHPGGEAGAAGAGGTKVSVWDFRPFVAITIGKQVLETSYLKNNHNPEFVQTLKFALGTAASTNGSSSSSKEPAVTAGDLSSTIVYIRVLDRCSKYSISSMVSMSSSASKMLGYVNVPLVEIVQAIRKANMAQPTQPDGTKASSKSTEIQYRLEGDFSDSRISCKFSWIPASNN